MMYPTNPTGYFNDPEPSLEPPDPVIIGYCSKCKGELYQDESTVYKDWKRMCVDCFRARRAGYTVRQRKRKDGNKTVIYIEHRREKCV